MKPRIYEVSGRAFVRATRAKRQRVPYEMDARMFWAEVEAALVLALPLVAVVVGIWWLAGR